jgi:hypothetical protein
LTFFLILMPETKDTAPEPAAVGVAQPEAA